jgi:hypothetical protein
MLLNLGLNKIAPSLPANLRKAPNIVAAPKSNIDVNAVLGLAPSKYEGLQSVGDTGYYYGDNKMYEPYTPSPVQYGRMIMGQFSPITGPFGTPYQPSDGPFGLGGISTRGGAVSGTITKDGQSFKPVDVDITGFSKSKIGDTDQYEYSPSMSYVYANTPRPAPLPTPNVTSFLSTPTAMATPTGNYGAGRYLSGLLGSPINYGSPNDTTGSNS